MRFASSHARSPRLAIDQLASRDHIASDTKFHVNNFLVIESKKKTSGTDPIQVTKLAEDMGDRCGCGDEACVRARRP